MARWKASLFGEPRLFTPGGLQLSMPSSIASVVGYLSTRSGFRANRAVLLSHIWPDQDEEQASHRLATSLWRIKKQSAHYSAPIRASGDVIELDPHIWIDSKAFEYRTRTLHAKRNQFSRKQLVKAANAYVGPYLEGHFDDWVLLERERLFYLYIDTNIRLAQLAMACENWLQAILHARCVCSLEPLREDAHRLLMQAYTQAGNRALALKQYRTCTDILMRELGVKPMAETAQLAARLHGDRQNDTLLDAPSISPPTASLKSSLVDGRNALCAAMAAFDRAISLI
jgi:DNA-binding SARP family transcriptional activator